MKVECTSFLKATMVPAGKLFAEECRSMFVLVNRHKICGFWVIMTDPAGPKVNEAETLARLLELELKQKRATWKQAGDRAKSIRAAGFLFLFVLIVACLVGGYFTFVWVSEKRANPLPTSASDH